MEYSDRELVHGIKGGDKSALELLVRRWYPRIYGYVFKLTGHEQDAYDLTQDVFIAMMQSIGSYTPWRKFDSWLFTIAHILLRRAALILHGIRQPQAVLSGQRYAMRVVAAELHHVALSGQPQRQRLHAQPTDDEQIAPRLAQLLVVRPLVEKISFHRAHVLRPLLLNVNERPLPPAKPEML